MSSDTIIGWGATLILKLSKMKLFGASQSSVVHVEAVLTSKKKNYQQHTEILQIRALQLCWEILYILNKK